jgi:hypothetical protein
VYKVLSKAEGVFLQKGPDVDMILLKDINGVSTFLGLLGNEGFPWILTFSSEAYSDEKTWKAGQPRRRNYSLRRYIWGQMFNNIITSIILLFLTDSH